jgi:hypothetical protein
MSFLTFYDFTFPGAVSMGWGLVLPDIISILVKQLAIIKERNE